MDRARVKAIDRNGSTTCASCGMSVVGPQEFHPYAACLMFKACGNGATVYANLLHAVEYGVRAGAKGLTSSEAMNDTRKTRV